MVYTKNTKFIVCLCDPGTGILLSGYSELWSAVCTDISTKQCILGH